jgi:hypothetical protein
MKWLAPAILAAGFAFPAAAQPATTTISVQGVGGWELICHVANNSGDQAEILDARRNSLLSRDFYSIACDQTGSGRGPLVVSISGPATCPFKGAPGGPCQQSFPSGRSGSFVVRPTRR